MATVAVALAGVLVAGVAVAQQGMGFGGGPLAASGQPVLGPTAPGGDLAQLFKMALARLGLSADQKTQILALIAAEKPTFEALAAQRKADAEALHTAAEANPPDPTAVGNAFLKVRADGQAIRDEVTKLTDAIEALLTTEQKAAFQAYLDAFKKFRHGGNG